jgi:conjugative transposon TraJ protein
MAYLTKQYRFIASFISLCSLSLLVPFTGHAQAIPNGVQALHDVLNNVYDQMIPLCSQILTVARAIASFGATFYIGVRVWRHIANAEAIDFFPLFRPFVLAILIGIYPNVLAVVNGILKPSVTATAAIVNDGNNAVWGLLAQREDAIKQTEEYKVLVGPTGEGDRDAWYKYTHPNGQQEGFWESIPNDIAFGWDKIVYGLKYMFKYLIAILLEIIYYAASLCIDTIRTFHLIVLAILGPFVFALACFDGFQQSLIQWLARYVNIYLWLPVANLFGAILAKIEQNMLQIDLTQIANKGTTVFTSTDLAYLIFMIIGIIGYFTVPGVANYIVHAHTVNPIMNKVSNLTSIARQSLVRGVSAGSSGGGGSSVPSQSSFNNPRNTVDGSWGDNTASNNYQGNKISG